MAMIDGIVMKGKRIIIPFHLQKHILQQLHSNHLGIEKTRLLVHGLVYWVNVNADIEKTMKQCATCLDYQKTKPHEKMIMYELLCILWKVVGDDIIQCLL